MLFQENIPKPIALEDLNYSILCPFFEVRLSSFLAHRNLP